MNERLFLLIQSQRNALPFGLESIAQIGDEGSVTQAPE